MLGGAVAQLKAMVGLDTSAYRAGANDIKARNANLRRSFQNIARAIGVSFGIAAIVQATRAISRWSAEVVIAARNSGILTEEMIGLNRVAIQTGLGVSDMQQLLTRMSDKVHEAAMGNKEANETFERMGLNVDELMRMRPADMFVAIAKAATETGIPLQNLTDLFGRRLGPNARAALEEIAKNGLPAVDEAAGRTAERIEMLGSRWAVTMDKMKTGTLSLFDSVGSLSERLASTIAQTAGLGGGMKAFRHVWDETGRRQEMEVDSRIEERQKRQDQERKEALMQRAAIMEQAIDDETQKLEKAMQRIEQTARVVTPQAQGMERMGAAFGGARPQLQAVERQIQIARDQLRVQEEFSAKIDDLKEQLELARRDI
jgi:hypothetical protein